MSEPVVLPESFSYDLNRGTLLIIVLEGNVICGRTSGSLGGKAKDCFQVQREKDISSQPEPHCCIALAEIQMSCCTGLS